MLMTVTAAAPASAATYIVDTNALSISAVTLQDECGLSIFGHCFVTVPDVLTSSSLLSSFNGTPFTSQDVGGVATFRFAGDLQINAGDRVIGVGDRPASFVAGNDAVVAVGSSLEFSAGYKLDHS